MARTRLYKEKRRRSRYVCAHKRRYDSWQAAQIAIALESQRLGFRLKAYVCPHCGALHLAYAGYSPCPPS